MTQSDHSELMSAVQLVLQHGSLEAAVRHSSVNAKRLSKLIDRAVKLGYITNAKDAEKPVEASRSRGNVILHIPDLHAPFMARTAVEFIAECIKVYKPNDIVLAGDELDQHSMSVKHMPDPDGYSPGHELTAGLAQLKPLYDLIPNAKVCYSNHGARPFRKAYACGIPAAYLKTLAEFMHAPPGWVWEDEFIIDNIRFTHGEEATGTNGALQLAIRKGQSQAVGHWHGVAGPSYFNNGSKTVFGLYSGCLISEKEYAFAYGKTAKQKPILGLSVIDSGVPTFVPMQTDSSGDWIGRL